MANERFNQTAQTGPPDLLGAWLEWVGLDFDPFSMLDAATDSHLSDYLVGHQAFETVWGPWISFIFAPIGGGKTALRIRTAQACWVGHERNRPFPIPYIPPFLKWGTVLPSFEEHLEALIEAGAIQLFLALAHRPAGLLRLEETTRNQIRQFLRESLPGSLAYYLDELRQSFNLSALRELDPAFPELEPPDPAMIGQFCQVLTSPDRDPLPLPPAPDARWEMLRHFLLDELEFHSIFILLDGLDASWETASEPPLVVSSLAPLMPLIPDWSNRRVFVKGFLPAETQAVLQERFPALISQAQVAVIHWTAASLADVIRKRIYAASQGEFDGLAALTSPALRDIETIIVEKAIPLPREVLVLTRRVLIEHVKNQGSMGKIDDQDLEAALNWYQGNYPFGDSHHLDDLKL